MILLLLSIDFFIYLLKNSVQPQNDAINLNYFVFLLPKKSIRPIEFSPCCAWLHADASRLVAA